MKQILFISGNTLLLLQYSCDGDKIVYGIYDNVTLGVVGLWQGTCIINGTEKDVGNHLKTIIEK